MELPPPPPKKSETTKKLKPQTPRERKKLLEEIARQKQQTNNTLSRIDREVSEEKKLERQAANYIKRQTPIVNSEVLENAPKELTQQIEQRPVAFKPNSEKQIAFLSASEDEVLFGGGRGSGKSTALIVDPLAYIHNPNFRGVIIRRTMPELKDLIERAKDIYYKIVPTVQWRVKDSLFVFPSGARIEFDFLDNEADVERYRGQEYTWMGIDEITQLPEYSWYYKLKGSLRTADATLKTYIRATCNPTGVGIDWVKEYWRVSETEPNTTLREVYQTPIGEITLTKKWLQSTIFDNPDLIKADPTYVAKLMAAPPHLRKAWLEGDWDSIEGAAFQEFDKSIHTCQPFDVPKNWPRFRGADYGYGDGAACIWIAISPEKTYYVYREFVVNGRSAEKRYNAREFAINIRELEAEEHIRYGILDSSVWAQRGDSGPSLAEQMIKEGTRWRPADKSRGSRISGKNQLHQLLQVNPSTSKPNIIFFNTCLQTIRMMAGIPIDKNNAEDVDTDSPLDHQYDALRYAVMSRPQPSYLIRDSLPPKPINSTFGY